MKYLIVGLGNTGKTYENTRHNVGFMVLDAWAQEAKATFSVDRLALTAHVKYRSRHIHLIKPTTYMNESGKAVRYWAQQLKVPLSHTLVITDDIALPFGKLRLRPKGSSAGHNGLKSIEKELATQDYGRLRIGIGQRFGKGKQSEYVLTPFNGSETKQLPQYLGEALSATQAFVSIGINHAMNQYNGKA